MLLAIAEIIAAGAIITFIGTMLIARVHPPRGRFVDVGGLRQHLAEDGTGGSAPDTPKEIPIVLIHGAGCNLEDMRLAFGERLRGRRLILIDRPGHGWSERRGVDGSSLAYQARIIRDVLDRLGVSRAILVGHSWGGALALRFALDHRAARVGARRSGAAALSVPAPFDLVLRHHGAAIHRPAHRAYTVVADRHTVHRHRLSRRILPATAAAALSQARRHAVVIAAKRRFSRIRATSPICRKICRRRSRATTHWRRRPSSSLEIAI